MSVQNLQVQKYISTKYAPHIDVSDIGKHNETERSKHLLTRGLAALSLTYFADLEVEVACASVTDEPNDNGIDAIYFSSLDKSLYIVQSKWSKNESTIDVGSTLKFVRGINDLLTLKNTSFGSKITKRWSSLEDAVLNAKAINIIVAYSSIVQLADQPYAVMNEFLAKCNEAGEIAFLHVCNLKQFFSYIQKGAEGTPIEEEILMTNWNRLEGPCFAVYGCVSASDLAQLYDRHSHRIYAKNIRYFLGADTPANEGIISTLEQSPELFWYFNNGVTAIASKIEKKPVGGASHETGVFVCTNLSIVNGAQTVGGIHTVWKDSPAKTDQAKVPIRVISVNDAPDEFDLRITRASNTQNRIDAKNFVALDPEQDRLRIELLIDGIDYEYRQSETFSTTEASFELNEATIALACTQNDVSLVTAAKSKISTLWADITSAPYKKLFNANLTGKELWSRVNHIRMINKSLRRIQREEKKISVAASLFIQHMVFTRANFSLEGREMQEGIDTLTRELHKRLCELVDNRYPESYPGNVFKNAEKCKKIKEHLISE